MFSNSVYNRQINWVTVNKARTWKKISHGLIRGSTPKFASKNSQKNQKPVRIVDVAAEILTGHLQHCDYYV